MSFDTPPPAWKQSVRNLVCSGDAYPQQCNEIEALELLKRAAIEDPDLLLSAMSEAVVHTMGMIPITLAVLCSVSNNNFLKSQATCATIAQILLCLNPEELLEFVEYCKSKFLGRGFGSRPQKMVRKTMESWDLEMLRRFQVTQSKPLYGLLRLVHPRYRGDRGQVIKELLDV